MPMMRGDAIVVANFYEKGRVSAIEFLSNKQHIENDPVKKVWIIMMNGASEKYFLMLELAARIVELGDWGGRWGGGPHVSV